MLQKVLMITLYISLGFQSMAAVSINTAQKTAPQTLRQPASESPRAIAKSAQNICMIHSGDIGKLKYKGTSMEDAFTKVTDVCFQKRNDLFVRARNEQPSQDRQIQFAESCANSVKCI